MVTFRRLMLWFSLFTGVLAFLVLAGNLSAKEQMIFGAIILLLIIFLMGTGGGRKVERVRRRSELKVDEPEPDAGQELPAPVQSEEDASARRDAKLSRSRSGEPEPEPEEPEVEEVVVSLADDEVAVTVIEENVHVAEEFVAEIDAESMEEADILGDTIGIMADGKLEAFGPSLELKRKYEPLHNDLSRTRFCSLPFTPNS